MTLYFVLVLENPAKSSTKKPAPKVIPLMRQEPVNNDQTPKTSRPQLANKTLDTNVLNNYSIQWGKMRDSLLIKLEKQERPSAIDRENMVLIISKDIKAAYAEIKQQNPTIKQKTPGRAVYKAVVAAIFIEFPEPFKDTIMGQVVGDGQFSLMDQVETCVENMYRGKSASNGARSAPAKGNRSAACILPEHYAPTLNKHQRTEAEQTRLELLAIYRSSDERNWDYIKEKLTDSIGAQRAMIVAKKRIVSDIVERWPFLFELSGMLCHLDYITNSSLLTNFQNFIENDADDFINYLTLMSPAKIPNLKVKRSMALQSGPHARLLGIIMMLAAHFKEDISVLLQSVEVINSNMSYFILLEPLFNLIFGPCFVLFFVGY